MALLARGRDWARAIKRDVAVLALAASDPRTPWYARAVAVAVATYALSPIDLIPDFVPILGYLDDVIILPLGIMLAVRLVPAELMAELRSEAERRKALPKRWAGAAIVIALWIASAALAAWYLWALMAPG